MKTFCKKILNSKTGQSLLEMLIAIFVLVIALTATLVLISSSISAGRESKYRLTSNSLAREGIEIVRNIRDSNWIDSSSSSWNAGLYTDTTAIPVIDGSSPISLDFSADSFSGWIDRIKQNTNDYLQGSAVAGIDSVFFRMIFLEPICRQGDGDESFAAANTAGNDCGGDDEVGVRVRSEVRWPSFSSNKKVVLEERLYDWQTF